MNLYLTGPDGSGKSTLLTALKKEVGHKGVNVTNVWVRSPKILSKPLMAYCRLVGYTKYFIRDGIRYGYHDFSRSKFVSWLFPYLQYWDLRISLITKKKAKGIVFYDRYVLDTLADLMVSTGRFDLHRKSIGKAFIKLLPTLTTTLIVDVDEDLIRARKPDTLHDPNLTLKIKVYQILGKDLNIEKLNNNEEFMITYKNLQEIYYTNSNEGV